MSGYGPGILGATFRRTCGPTSSIFSTAARRRPHPVHIPTGTASCRLLRTTKDPTVHLRVDSIDSRNATSVSSNQAPTGSTHRLDTASGLKARPSTFVTFPARSGVDLSIKWGLQSLRRQTLRKHCISKGVFESRRYRSDYTEQQNKSPVEKDSSSSPKSDANHAPKSTEFPRATTGPNPSKHLIDRLPTINHIHRPSKEELLAAATGFWSRLKVRFKWFSIRSGRPFNIDEISAFFSWVLLGHVLWIVLGTTTFFSLAILAVNTVFAQG